LNSQIFLVVKDFRAKKKKKEKKKNSLTHLRAQAEISTYSIHPF